MYMPLFFELRARAPICVRSVRPERLFAPAHIVPGWRPRASPSNAHRGHNLRHLLYKMQLTRLRPETHDILHDAIAYAPRGGRCTSTRLPSCPNQSSLVNKSKLEVLLLIVATIGTAHKSLKNAHWPPGVEPNSTG